MLILCRKDQAGISWCITSLLMSVTSQNPLYSGKSGREKWGCVRSMAVLWKLVKDHASSILFSFFLFTCAPSLSGLVFLILCFDYASLPDFFCLVIPLGKGRGRNLHTLSGVFV